MSLTCPTGFDTVAFRRELSAVYARVAEDPLGDFHFHRGAVYAVEFLGYEMLELKTLPDRATASFAGIGNPHKMASIEPGQVVLDVGSGAGMDLLLAARRVGPTGRAIGVDLTEAMRRSAWQSATEAGLVGIVEIVEGDAEALPVEVASVDVVISNGVLNLATDKHKAFSEIRRVLRPGGRLLLADMVVQDELSECARSDIDLWAG